MSNKFVFGIDAGGTKVAYGLFKSGGKLIDRFVHASDISADGPAFCDTVIDSIHQMLEKNNISMTDVEGVGFCMPSFIFFEEGKVCITSALPKIKDFLMRDYLEERLHVPVVLDNDCNVAALAEHRHGAGRDRDTMVYIAASTGIGSGIIINKQLFRGSYGWAGECGHMIATPGEGIMCGCQNQGCYMSYASGRYIPIYVAERLNEGVESELSQYDKINCRHILTACKNGDALALEAIERMAHYWAVCLFNVYQMLNINLFVLGGGLVNFGDILFSRVKEKFDSYNHIPYPVEFRFAELTEDFGIVGAAELIAPIIYE